MDPELIWRSPPPRPFPRLSAPVSVVPGGCVVDLSSSTFACMVISDIIGVLKGKSAVDIVGEERKQTKKMKIKLENECGRTLEVLLWGDYVELLNHYVETHPGRITVILQFVKLKYFNGLPFVSNSFYTSRLLLNWKCEALTCFLASIGNLDDNNTTLEDLNVKRDLSINDDFSQCTNRKYISDFLEIKEPCFCAISGTIKQVETQHDWFYSSCKTCLTKVTKQRNGAFYCDKCSKIVKFVSTRFKVVFKVEDETGIASILMFCREMTQLIQKSATELRDTLIKNDEDELFPMEFDELLQKQYFFKLNITDYSLSNNYKVYTVSRVTDDPDMLSAHFALLKRDEELDTESADFSLPTSLYNCNGSTSLIANNSENNSSDTCNITPTKRGIEEVVQGELYILAEEGQSSVVRPKVVVKVEKDA
ncbi:hypothetical protein KSS87_007569 [Heliosperma pusillum]|nr:hypothetical protein KSS87_007569 [Heliosperma pusillum]